MLKFILIVCSLILLGAAHASSVSLHACRFLLVFFTRRVDKFQQIRWREARCHHASYFTLSYPQSQCCYVSVSEKPVDQLIYTVSSPRYRIRRRGSSNWKSDGASSSVVAPAVANETCDPFTPESEHCTLGNMVVHSVNKSHPSDYSATIAFARARNIHLVVRNASDEYVDACLRLRGYRLLFSSMNRYLSLLETLLEVRILSIDSLVSALRRASLRGISGDADELQ